MFLYYQQYLSVTDETKYTKYNDVENDQIAVVVINEFGISDDDLKFKHEHEVLKSSFVTKAES